MGLDGKANTVHVRSMVMKHLMAVPSGIELYTALLSRKEEIISLETRA
jgi:hypothetical protein